MVYGIYTAGREGSRRLGHREAPLRYGGRRHAGADHSGYPSPPPPPPSRGLRVKGDLRGDAQPLTRRPDNKIGCIKTFSRVHQIRKKNTRRKNKKKSPKCDEINEFCFHSNLQSTTARLARTVVVFKLAPSFTEF